MSKNISGDNFLCKLFALKSMVQIIKVLFYIVKSIKVDVYLEINLYFYYNHYNKLNPKRALLEVHSREITK